MRGKWHKWKCLLLAVFVLCTGLYIETAKTVSVFMCTSVSSSDAYLLVADNTYDEAQLCTAETVGVRDTAKQALENGINYSRRVAKVALEFLCSDCFLLQGESISAKPEVAEFIVPHCQEIIAMYIHKSDGEK